MLLSSCAGASPQSASATPSRSEAAAGADQPIPADLRDVVARSVEIGRELYVLDKVAAIGTDVLLAHVPHPDAKKVVGYLPLREGDESGPSGAFQVVFFTSEQPTRVAYRIHLLPKQQPRFEALEPPEVAPDLLAGLVRARQAAIAAVAKPAQPLNPIVIPAEAYGESGTLVYLLAGTTKPHWAVLGKHYRALVADGGSQVSYLKELTKSVVEMPTQVDGSPAEALVITHLVTDYPLETHVFTSLLVGLPVFVATSRGNWRVNGDKIAFLGAK
jgi:hypothetical protein